MTEDRILVNGERPLLFRGLRVPLIFYFDNLSRQPNGVAVHVICYCKVEMFYRKVDWKFVDSLTFSVEYSGIKLNYVAKKLVN